VQARVTQPAQTQPAQTPAAAGPQAQPPAASGADHVQVAAKNLVLGDRELAAMVAAKDTVGKTATIVVRQYRSNDILGKDSTPVETRQQGKKLSLSLQYRTPGVALGREGLIEIEVVVPTTAGRFLYYREAMPAASDLSLVIPFFLYTSSVPLAWPAIGSPVQVAGYVLLGGERPEESEALQKNAKGEYGIDIQIADVKTGRSYGGGTVWRKPGLARGQALTFAAPMAVSEGAVVRYTMTATAANGRAWTAAGQAQVWTTRLRYEGGFEPVLLPLSENLAPAAEEKGGKPVGKDKKQ
jgi:hypothetical protein